MEINRDTRLADILAEYPWLKDEAMKISDKFKLLDTPLGKVMFKKATIADMSSKSGIPVEQIIAKITQLIEEHE